MEGTRMQPPSSAIPFFWSPGWNSVQSVNKYQEETGGALRGGDPGIRLIGPATASPPSYFVNVPRDNRPGEGRVLVVPVHRIFGSDEMSALAPAVAGRCESPRIVIGEKLASALQDQDSLELTLRINGQVFRLPTQVDQSMPDGVAGLPVGLRGMEYCRLPAMGEVVSGK
jgi:NADH-quinone oxidoreductase subunit G